MNEPVQTELKNDTGRPQITEEQYKKWLEDMSPFLKNGNSLWYAMEKADLLKHNFVIYEKYRSGDWFSQKVDAYRAYPAELNVRSIVNLINVISAKVLTEKPLTREEYDLMKFFAEKYRGSQSFFVSRTELEVADKDKLGKILDNLEDKTDYDEVGRKAKEQMVATNTPVQDQKQAGKDSNI